MEAKLAVVVAACLAAVFLGEATAQQQQAGQGSQCLQLFASNLFQCAQNNSLNVQSFQYVITNSTMGSQPAANFSQELCSKQQQMMGCMVNVLQTLMRQALCQPAAAQGAQPARDDQRPLMDAQFRAVVFTLDQHCAHPCRKTLANDLRGCYTEANLDADLFLSNTTMARGAVIGTTQTQVAQFCGNKDALTNCMRKKRDNCPDAPIVLQAMGLDIDSMHKGITVLCHHQKVYLKGIDCFSEPTSDVTRCQQEQANDMMKAMQRAQAESWNETRFFQAFCGVRMQHVVCDLSAWKLKQHESCIDVVIGLRTELECELMPDDCLPITRQKFDSTCHEKNYRRDERNKYASAATASLALSAVLVGVMGWVFQP